jgi:hypothetical protein
VPADDAPAFTIELLDPELSKVEGLHSAIWRKLAEPDAPDGELPASADVAAAIEQLLLHSPDVRRELAEYLEREFEPVKSGTVIELYPRRCRPAGLPAAA